MGPAYGAATDAGPSGGAAERLARGGFPIRQSLRAETNPGDPPRALQRITSGGELSRVMLSAAV